MKSLPKIKDVLVYSWIKKSKHKSIDLFITSPSEACPKDPSVARLHCRQNALVQPHFTATWSNAKILTPLLSTVPRNGQNTKKIAPARHHIFWKGYTLGYLKKIKWKCFIPVKRNKFSKPPFMEAFWLGSQIFQY